MYVHVYQGNNGTDYYNKYTHALRATPQTENNLVLIPWARMQPGDFQYTFRSLRVYFSLISLKACVYSGEFCH